MIINKKRIRNVELYWHLIDDNNEFYIGLNDIERFKDRLIQIGFSESFELGETILPNLPYYGCKGATL